MSTYSKSCIILIQSSKDIHIFLLQGIDVDVADFCLRKDRCVMWPKSVLEHNAEASGTDLLLREYVHLYLLTCSKHMKPLGMFSIGQFFLTLSLVIVP